MPAELARRFERRSQTYEARALPTELHQHKLWRWRGELHSRMICFAGRRLAVLATPPQPLERSTGIAPVLPDWRSGVLLLYELRLERAARVELASSGWRPEAPAAIPCSRQQTLAVATGVEPVPPDRQSGILPLDSPTTLNLA